MASDQHPVGDAAPADEAEGIPGHRELLDEIQAEIFASPGAVALRKWEHLDRLWYASERNGVELLSFLATSTRLDHGDDERWPPFGIDDEGPEHQRRWYRELVRLLNNYVSASDALAGHAIKTMDQYPPDLPFKVEYERRVTSVRGDRGNFIGRLRNAALHAGETLPFVITLTFAAQNRPEQLTIGLTVAGLLDEFGSWWSAPARRFIEAHDDKIDLVETVQAHLDAMIDLYDWLFPQFHAVHGADLAASDVLVDEFNETLRGRGRLDLR